MNTRVRMLDSGCICTGCLLYDPLTRQIVNGDLHHIRATLIFNATFDSISGEPYWRDHKGSVNDLRALIRDNTRPALEFYRRGVFVLLSATPTDLLLNYVAKGSRFDGGAGMHALRICASQAPTPPCAPN